MKRRPRIILKLCVFLLAGAIVNVAVAWGESLTKGGCFTLPPQYHHLREERPRILGFPIASIQKWSATIYHPATKIRWELMWPGFAANTVIYGAVLWLVWLTPGIARRCMQSEQGCCRACGYSLHNRAPDSTRCPECGATV